MAVPKKKTTKAKRNQRRASNWKLTLPEISDCPNCHSKVRPHHICNVCGHYRGQQVVAIKEKKEQDAN
jgi:large subunit ribosomal protein L32